MPKRRAEPPKQKSPEQRVANARGHEYQAEKLTGAHAQKGCYGGDASKPRWVYEVLWQGGVQTYEPKDNLVGWEMEMRAVDEKYELQERLPPINPAAAAAARHEQEAKEKAHVAKKAKEDRRVRLERLRRRRGGKALSDDDGGEEDTETRELSNAAL